MRAPIRMLMTVALPVALVAGLSACTQPAPVPLPTSSTPAAPTPSPTPRLGVDRIAVLARAAVRTGTVISVEDESDGASYEVHVVDSAGAEQEVHLDPAGAVRSGPADVAVDADRRSDNRAAVAAVSVSLKSASDRMVAAVPGGRVTAIALEEQDGRIGWAGDVTDADGVRHDVRIDGVSGAVARNQPDRADPQPTSGGS